MTHPRHFNPPAVDDPFHLAIAGNFGGRGNGVPVQVDRDNFDDVLASFGVRLEMPVVGEILFRDMDDFHPDRLWERVGLFQSLRQARSDIAQASPTVTKAPLTSAPLRSGSLLEDALTATESRTASRPAPADPLRAWLDERVAPHVEKRELESETSHKALVDQVIAAQMRAVLHYPDFQALEAAWRGVEFLIRRLESDSRIKVWIVDTHHGEAVLEEALKQHSPWGLVVGLYRFGPADLERLHRFCTLAQQFGTSFVAEAAPELLGLDTAEGLPDPRSWRAPAPEWEEFRVSEASRSGGLAFPRFLLRLPYGSETSPCEQIRFEEMPREGGHERFLWGNPALVCALLLAQSFEQDGWDLRPGKVSNVGQLPVYLWRRDGDIEAQPCAETLMTERAAQQILERGVIALASLKGSDEIRLVRFQSVTRPPSPLAGRWS